MIICKKIGDTFAQSMVDNNQISLEDREVYSYCVEYALDLVCFNGSKCNDLIYLYNHKPSVFVHKNAINSDFSYIAYRIKRFK